MSAPMPAHREAPSMEGSMTEHGPGLLHKVFVPPTPALSQHGCQETGLPLLPRPGWWPHLLCCELPNGKVPRSSSEPAHSGHMSPTCGASGLRPMAPEHFPGSTHPWGGRAPREAGELSSRNSCRVLMPDVCRGCCAVMGRLELGLPGCRKQLQTQHAVSQLPSSLIPPLRSSRVTAW